VKAGGPVTSQRGFVHLVIKDEEEEEGLMATWAHRLDAAPRAERQVPSLQPRCVIPEDVAIGLGSRGNWPGQRQDPWKYIDASSPHRKFNQVLRPESQLTSEP
jgi:hypothetical protein